jgi:hypothetical protein
MTALSPQNGVRVLLELERADDAAIEYGVELHAASAAWAGKSTIDAATGAVSFAAFHPIEGTGAPDPWMVESARGFLRTVHKNHVAERDWPRRLLRWRAERP